MKILIGIPHTGSILTPCVKSLLSVDLSDFEHKKIYFEQGSLLHFQRNNLVQKAVDEEADYLFFVDSDVGFPQDTVKKLVAHKKEIVSGLYFSKILPFLPVLYTKLKKKGYVQRIEYPEGLFETDAVGAGCLLIKTSAFKKIKKPYFSFSERDVVEGQPLSEDIYFCEKARAAGLKVHCDSSVKCSHHGHHAVTERSFLQVKPRLKYSDEVKKLIK